MEHLLAVDWTKFFVPEHSILEMVLRGTVMYLALFVFLRFMARRIAGTMGTADVLVIVLLADAAQNGMSNDYKSVTEGIVLVATILAWDLFIDWLAFHVSALRPILQHPTLPVVRNGRLLYRNMRREMISREELLSQLRQQGVEDQADVKLAQIEEDGHLSVITKTGRPPTSGAGKKDRAPY
jgi:uncharacterized membrane protein YcaP (DUF421 family)